MPNLSETRYVLVTGSRIWPPSLAHMVDAILDGEQANSPHQMTLMHGHCPSGADRMANRWAVHRRFQNVHVARRPADWSRDCDAECHHPKQVRGGMNFCPAAGVIRNQQMVNELIGYPNVIVHAFIVDGVSTGTLDCASRAESADLFVVRHRISRLTP